MFGVIVNTITVILGSSLGLVLNKGIPERILKVLMTALALCTIYIGIDGALSGSNTLVLIISMCIGAVIGELIDIDKWLTRLAEVLEQRFNKKKDGKNVSIVEGFVSASLLFCVGAMTLVGSLQAGLVGDNTLLLTKATLDLVSSFALASTLGVGVLLSAAFVFAFQGGLVMLSGLLSPLLSDIVIAEITCVGSVIIVAIGLNLIGLTKIKVANLMPAVILPMALCPIYDLVSSMLANII